MQDKHAKIIVDIALFTAPLNMARFEHGKIEALSIRLVSSFTGNRHINHYRHQRHTLKAQQATWVRHISATPQSLAWHTQQEVLDI